MAGLVVAGAQWGDEGKGKIVDLLSEFADLVVRFHGGANAGHTLVVGEDKLVTHLIPSGVLRPGTRCVIGPAVVVDPQVLVEEIALVQQRGLLQRPEQLLVSHRCHLVLPYHKLLDAARESARGAHKIGTTLRGIGPCLEDKVARCGLRVGDLADSALVNERLAERLPEVNALLVHYGREPVRLDDLYAGLREQAARILPFLGDAGALVRAELARGRAVLFEGAQGAMLDIDHGTYPYVTSSNTVAGAVCPSLGLGPHLVEEVMGVSKAYTTRVGEGPFPTELADERGQLLRARGHEFGATTGRPRRCGWLDLVALRYAVALHGCTSLGLTKLDVLGGFGPLKVAVAYRLDGRELQQLPTEPGALERVEPVYEELEGWEEDIRDLREREALPTPVQRLLKRIEGDLGVPVEVISVGPARAETILSHNPFRRKHA
jgi:adenylosuccinate synthase